MTTSEFAADWLGDVRVQFEKMKRLAEGALAQASDDHLNVAIDPESNSLAVIVKHMAGNMRSRWTGFLTTDGEKPDRNRGVALWGNLVISVTGLDGRVIATDKESGKVVWDKNLHDQEGMEITAAPHCPIPNRSGWSPGRRSR